MYNTEFIVNVVLGCQLLPYEEKNSEMLCNNDNNIAIEILSSDLQAL